jgi:uncharacterized oxidoreductase
MQILSPALEDFVSRLFQAAGVLRSEAVPVAASLVGSNLRGHDSHGVVQVPGYVRQLRAGTLAPGVELKVLSETPSLLVTDAGRGFGSVQTARLIERLVPKAREQGIACGTLRTSGHLGRLGEWAERAAREGVAGLVATNDNGVLQCVAPPGGVEPRISTNPIAIGVPTGNGPLVLDLSTSIVANGKVRLKLTEGEACPPGWLLDADGEPTTDPAVRFSDPRGTLLPLGGEQGGYKGFGLGLFFDILVGGLSGGFSPPAPASAPLTNNALVVLWMPERFAGESHFLGQADELIAYVRATRCKAGVDAIRVPGDRSQATLRERMEKGIALDDGTWRPLVELARELGVDVP